MIKRGASADQFVVDFSKVPRRKKVSLGVSLESVFVRTPSPITVDGHALARAVCGVMDQCDFADVQGRPWLWNEYVVFLSRPDLERLRDVEEALRRDLLTLLNEEIVRRDARMPDGFLVRLLADEENEVPVGAGVIRVRHRKDLATVPLVAGEITMRADKLAAPARPAPDSTERDAGLRVRSAGGAAGIPEGRRVSLGRSAPELGEGHVALPGAGPRINRKQVGVLVRGDQAEMTREIGANPVEVGGRALAEGEVIHVALPVELSLSHGAWKGTLCR
ncbi:MAG: hypothetical protein EXR71_12335 [Myxococcales bacterium]|nr:hypothetical protein [Myxococcales bacterium]